MEKTNRRGLFKQLGLVGGILALNKHLPEDEDLKIYETEIDEFKGTMSSTITFCSNQIGYMNFGETERK